MADADCQFSDWSDCEDLLQYTENNHNLNPSVNNIIERITEGEENTDNYTEQQEQVDATESDSDFEMFGDDDIDNNENNTPANPLSSDNTGTREEYIMQTVLHLLDNIPAPQLEFRSTSTTSNMTHFSIPFMPVQNSNGDEQYLQIPGPKADFLLSTQHKSLDYFLLFYPADFLQKVCSLLMLLLCIIFISSFASHK